MNESQMFGKVVRQIRQRHHWSQEALAEKADLNRCYLGELERGHAVPSLQTIYKLANALGLRASNLLELAEGDKPFQIAERPISG